MVTPRQYATAGALRAALEARLLDRSRRDNADLQRLRRQVAFDRLLARMFGPAYPARDGWVLKGGYALELRFQHSRATKDLDLTVKIATARANAQETSVASLRERLLTAASARLPDFFAFDVGEAMLALDQAPEGGARFPVDARIDGRTFVKFHVDLGTGDEVLEPLDEIVGEDWLGFAGIMPTAVPALSVEQHWAEKLHAYTRPSEGRTNTRVKDLVDLVLLIELETLAGDRVLASVEATFTRRRTHEIPRALPIPPADWKKPFAALAEECQMAHTPITAHAAVDSFWRGLHV
ncbi:MAG: nucleotidyl transferase AbiEii/AbiGii toxin family protein [Gemmatimonadaceae bacterium]